MSSSQEKNILNKGTVGVVADSEPHPPPDKLALELQKTMLRMKGEYMSPDGKGVDYGSLTKSELFSRYQQLANQLDQCDPLILEENDRKAFFINIYNALTIHGLATAEQLPKSVLEVSRFWQVTCYTIGGHVYSLDDIEHGVLRGNKPHPSATEAPFGDSDPRRSVSMKSCDPRIHFALVCGAKSCPAIQVYSAKNLDRALNQAAASFCSQEVVIEAKSRKVTLSKIFHWYGSDFGSSERERLQWICQHLSEDKKSAMEDLLTSSDPIAVESSEYNWMLNKL